MKVQKRIDRVSSKIKRGTEFLYQGKSVWVELQQSFGNVLVCDNELRRLEDTYFQVKRSELDDVRKGRTAIQAKPKTLSKDEKVSKDGLNAFFDLMALKMPFNCQSCKKPLYAANKFGKRCCTAHILAKSDFPSIATNEHNILFLGSSLLGICECHNSWDQSIEKRISMPIYQTAIVRYVNHLAQYLTEKERIKAEKYLNIKS